MKHIFIVLFLHRNVFFFLCTFYYDIVGNNAVFTIGPQSSIKFDFFFARHSKIFVHPFCRRYMPCPDTHTCSLGHLRVCA